VVEASLAAGHSGESGSRGLWRILAHSAAVGRARDVYKRQGKGNAPRGERKPAAQPQAKAPANNAMASLFANAKQLRK
ncbi:hypothetical protein DNK08_16195, partial [Stutzerimonas kirkiae]